MIKYYTYLPITIRIPLNLFTLPKKDEIYGCYVLNAEVWQFINWHWANHKNKWHRGLGKELELQT